MASDSELQIINKNLHIIKDLLIARNILADLEKDGLKFSEETKREIQRGTDKRAAEMLMEELICCTNVGWFDSFVKALEAQNIGILVDLLRYNKKLKPDHLRNVERIRRCTKLLEEEVKVDNILSKCVAECLINDRNREEIECAKQQHGNKNAMKLMSTFIYRQERCWFSKFMQILKKSEYGELAETIKGVRFSPDRSSMKKTAGSSKVDANEACPSIMKSKETDRETVEDTVEKSQTNPKSVFNGDTSQSPNGPALSEKPMPPAQPKTKLPLTKCGSVDQLTKNSKCQASTEAPLPESKCKAPQVNGAQPPPSGSNSKVYFLVKINGRIKKCKGCENPFIKESDECVLKLSGARTCYFHANHACVIQTDAAFSVRHVEFDSEFKIGKITADSLRRRGFTIPRKYVE